MKILLLAPQPFFQYRGTPIAVRLLAEVLAKHGHRVCILAYHEGEPLDLPNVRVVRTPALPGIRKLPPGPSWKKYLCDVLMIGSAYRAARSGRFDLVHAVEEAVFIAMLLKARFGIPYVYDMDSSLADQMIEKYGSLRPLLPAFKLCERAAIRASEGVIAVCKYLEGVARENAPDKPILRLEDISLLGTVFDEAPQDGAKLGIEPPVVMYVGNLEKHQGIDLLLEGFALAAGREARAKLVIVGGADGDIEKYRERAVALGIADRTRFVGPRPVSQLGSLLAQADVLVSPRIRGKNTPMKIYSYLDSGKPLVATRLETHTQILQDDVALLVPPEPNGLADGLVKLLAEPELGAALARRARAYVKVNFSSEAFERKIGDFYEEILARAVRRRGGP